MSVTYYKMNQILDSEFGNTAYTVPSTLYIGLSTTTVSISGTGYTEPTGGAYARVAVVNNKSNFTVSSNGSLTNNTTITFPESTAAWGTITYVIIADSVTVGGGNVLYFEALSTAKTIQTATTVLFAVGAMTIYMSNT
jgi:hypothetical protein